MHYVNVTQGDDQICPVDHTGCGPNNGHTNYKILISKNVNYIDRGIDGH